MADQQESTTNGENGSLNLETEFTEDNERSKRPRTANTATAGGSSSSDTGAGLGFGVGSGFGQLPRPSSSSSSSSVAPAITPPTNITTGAATTGTVQGAIIQGTNPLSSLSLSFNITMIKKNFCHCDDHNKNRANV